MSSIIQFFHPGQEHGYDIYNSKYNCYLKDWHTIVNKNGKGIDHRRKFLLNEGYFIKNNEKHNGKLLFWSEWEPPSRVELLKQQTYCPPYGKNPEYLHIPFLPPADQLKKYQEKLFQDRHFYQNTDPFVFGDNFIYAICQQKKKSLRVLDEGSLIIFGSRANRRFVIDTVFVVKSKRKYHSLDDIMDMNLDIYPEIVTKLILDKNNRINEPEGLTLYKGATYDDPVNEMYSFIPAKVYDGKKIGFPRFYMPDDFYKTKFKNYFQNSQERYCKIFEGGMMGIKYNDNTKNEVKEFWEYIRTVVSKNHVLGYNLKMPEADESLTMQYPMIDFGEINTTKTYSNRNKC